MPANERKRLLTGGASNPLAPELRHAILKADEIDLAVAFVKSSGLDLIFDALAQRVTEEPTAQLRILTSDYLYVTDPSALRQLMRLAERGADVRVFETFKTSFHLKTYIFMRTDDGKLIGDAFVGSSNISETALTTGLEWNYRVVTPDDHGTDGAIPFQSIRSEFESLFNAEPVRALTHQWIDRYEHNRPDILPAVAPGSDDAEPEPAKPTHEQESALNALKETRANGYRRGLVVMATGLGKTFLAAFDAQQMGAHRVLFIAHREEILLQAEETFQRVMPKTRVGRYYGDSRDSEAHMLFASVQTLHRASHLERFAPDHFDCIVVDEFHHAAANTYLRLLQHFQSKFLLGLTATPDRADQSDILSLCDDNLVYNRNLFDGINAGLLCPFSYHGIFDENVDYEEIPWRNGRFDPDTLSTKLATLGRARHALKEWREKGLQRTLAFCISTRHADFMADQFKRNGVPSVSVHTRSDIDRHDAIQRLNEGAVSVVFSVDLFNEGVDVPDIDTVMMLRPTDSKVLFLQQIGRGLRRSEKKERLIILDFIGNHKGFLNKPQALFGIEGTGSKLSEFANRVRSQQQTLLPEGCFANYDLEIINFLQSLNPTGIEDEYKSLKTTMGRRPTLLEVYRAGISISKLRKQYGSWWAFLDQIADLDQAEKQVLEEAAGFLKTVETTSMTKSFKMVLLEALIENSGFEHPLTVTAISDASRKILLRRPQLQADLKEDHRDLASIDQTDWMKYWRKNPIAAWIGEYRSEQSETLFTLEDDRLIPKLTLPERLVSTLGGMLKELVDYRLSTYQERLPGNMTEPDNVVPFSGERGADLPYFPNIRIACGHFKTGTADAEEYVNPGDGYGQVDPNTHFIAQASGESMNGGKNPIRDGDYLLLERINPNNAGSITGSTMAIERQDESGDNQYLLRVVTKQSDGQYMLRANNPDYEDLPAAESMRTFARLKAVIDPFDLAIGQTFMREEIPPLFSDTFKHGSWNQGHIVLREQGVHVLLVTLNKQGRQRDHRYQDYFIDEQTFHWQSQNGTSPATTKGREIIEHRSRDIDIHLFVRENKLGPDGKAAPFRYYGKVDYLSHEGERPMSVTFQIQP